MKTGSDWYHKNVIPAQHWYVQGPHFNQKPLSSPTDPLSIGVYRVRVLTKNLFHHLLIN